MNGLPAHAGRWLLSLAIAAALLPAVAAADDWPTFRGNAARTGAIESAGGPMGGHEWIFPTGGPIRSSPAVVANMMFFGSDDGNVYAVNVDDGTAVWEYQTGGPVLSSPAVADGWVFVGGVFGFYQIPVGGGDVKVLYDLDAVDTSPVVDGGRVYFVTRSGVLMGVDYVTGFTFLEEQLSRPISSSPALANGRLYLFVGEDLVSFTLEGTDPNHAQMPGGGADPATPVLGENRVYFVGASNGVVYAVSLDGRECAALPDVTAALGSSPAVSNDSIAFLTDDGYALRIARLGDFGPCPENDVAVALQRSQQMPPPRPFLPVIAEYTVFLGTPSGEFSAVDEITGEPSETFVSKKLGGPVESSPAVANGFVYVGCTDGNLYAYPLFVR